MKKLLLLILLLSSFTLAQPFTFKVYESMLLAKESGKTLTIETDLTFKLTNYTLKIIETDIVWIFYGEMHMESEEQFYTYAHDSEGLYCRIWFDLSNESAIIIGVEYNDIGLFYKAHVIDTQQ